MFCSRRMQNEPWLFGFPTSAIKKDIPLHEKMLTAEKAFFNAGSDVRGAMGKSILPFATKGEVEAFTKEHGGKIVNYSEVNLELLKSLKGH